MRDTAASLGLYGLGVMGSALALNILERGFPLHVANRTAAKVPGFLAEAGPLGQGATGHEGLAAMAATMAPPRAVILMVDAGPEVDQAIDALGAARDAAFTAIVAIFALALILAPFIWRLGRNLAAERAEQLDAAGDTVAHDPPPQHTLEQSAAGDQAVELAPALAQQRARVDEVAEALGLDERPDGGDQWRAIVGIGVVEAGIWEVQGDPSHVRGVASSATRKGGRRGA